MKWASSLQSSSSFETSLIQASHAVVESLGVKKADLGVVFFSPAYRAEAIDCWARLSRDLPFRTLIGCTGGGVIGAGKEEESRPAISLTGAVLPEVTIRPFWVGQESLPDGDAGPKAWRDVVGVPANETVSFLVLADPFSLDADALVNGLDFAYPGSVKIGGLSSGAAGPGENMLILGERLLSKGAVALALTGNIHVEAVVAQGCRPIGEPMSITSVEDNILLGVNNRTPLGYIQDLYERLPDEDKELVQTSLFVGLLMNSFTLNPKQGDFLIRNIIGVDQGNGLLAIGAPLRIGQTMQFHLRDSRTSHDDLKMMLRKSESLTRLETPQAPTGALLFSCLGRGQRLYGKPDHDSNLFKSVMGALPVGGFFCNGEIGPVSGKTYLHGYTSSIALFSPQRVPSPTSNKPTPKP